MNMGAAMTGMRRPVHGLVTMFSSRCRDMAEIGDGTTSNSSITRLPWLEDLGGNVGNILTAEDAVTEDLDDWRERLTRRRPEQCARPW
jgi:hypothetical protein